VNNAQLLSGRGTGAPLFLAYCSGLFAIYPIVFVASVAGLEWQAFWVCFIGFSIWQAVLLTASWSRRTLWSVLSAAFAIPFSNNRTYANIDFWVAFGLVVMSYGFLLFGVRKRWLLSVVPIFLCFLCDRHEWQFYYSFEAGRDILRESVPDAFTFGYLESYIIAVNVVFGALAAFSMPPIERHERAQDNSKF
jgi:hypothetical protein